MHSAHPTLHIFLRKKCSLYTWKYRTYYFISGIYVTLCLTTTTVTWTVKDIWRGTAYSEQHRALYTSSSVSTSDLEWQYARFDNTCISVLNYTDWTCYTTMWCCSDVQSCIFVYYHLMTEEKSLSYINTRNEINGNHNLPKCKHKNHCKQIVKCVILQYR